MTTRLLLCSIFGLSAYGSALADDWPQWRDPAGTGVVPGGDFPTDFSLKKNLLWSEELSGKGSSTPTVFGENLFLTVPIDDQDSVLCFDMKGEKLWEKILGKDRKGQRVHKNGRAYVLTDRGVIRCLDLKTGEDLWEEALPRAGANFFSSPILAGDVLYAGREDGMLFCLKIGKDGAGSRRWEIDRAGGQETVLFFELLT